MTAPSTFSSWPQTGTPLSPGVVCRGFGAVTQEILAEIVRRIVVSLHPEKIILFGSYAYGNPSADSDVDLLIIQETTQSPADRQVAVSRLIRPRPFPIDFLVRTPQELDAAISHQDPFLTDIIGRGKVLYG